ncbi:MAG TPA: 50S ribosomal protein L21e, partial [archaeon]|nr:50S ribosomal protein L21e [archaeon]
TTLTQHLQSFSEGQRVIVRIDPGFQRGFPHPKYEGRAGKVVGMQGRSYLVQVSDGDSEKVLVSLPVHLKALN